MNARDMVILRVSEFQSLDTLTTDELFIWPPTRASP